MSTVIVVGAGAAGTGAALAAARAGAHVVIVDGGSGASTLSTGALDVAPWQDAPAQPATVPASVRTTLELLSAYALPDRGALLLTTAGLVRTARGFDTGLLDVGPLAGRRIGVVRCDRPAWHAPTLARAWGEAFMVVDATVLRYADERVLPDADFAARHDDTARLGWLAERLREAVARGGAQALVLPPSLGVDGPCATALSKLVGVPCGEALALPGGPSGLRFERARDRALSSAGVERVRARAMSAESTRVTLEEGGVVDGDAVVIATGGILGGGVEFAPSDAELASALPPFARAPFRIGLLAPRLTLGARGLAFGGARFPLRGST